MYLQVRIAQTYLQLLAEEHATMPKNVNQPPDRNAPISCLQFIFHLNSSEYPNIYYQLSYYPIHLCKQKKLPSQFVTKMSQIKPVMLGRSGTFSH